jgi:hypothetical protein
MILKVLIYLAFASLLMIVNSYAYAYNDTQLNELIETSSKGKPYCPRCDLRGIKISSGDIDLENANLEGADLTGAALISVNFRSANLKEANFESAILYSARFDNANLWLTKLPEAQIAYANFTDAIYAPASPPPNSYLAGIEGVKTIVTPSAGDIIGLVQLRKLLKDAGLPEEREATYAIERNKTNHLLFGEFWPIWDDSQNQTGSRVLRWRYPLSLAEGAFRLVAFEWPVAYGLYPGRALLVLFGLIGGFALVYTLALVRDAGSIYLVRPEKRLDWEFGGVKLVGQAEVERLMPWGLWAALGPAFHFSILSAFHIGFREFSFGTWLARLQRRQYMLEAVGWVRTVSGIQSLLSVYLLAMWALTYFGRPFG